MTARPYNPKFPTRPVPIMRQAACLRVAAGEHALGYWSYLARFSGKIEFKLPDEWAWCDIPEGLADASETLALLAELAALRGDERVKRDIRVAIDLEKQRRAEASNGR